MKTYETREGKWISEKPKEYFKGFDSHGNKVFVGDTMIRRLKKLKMKEQLLLMVLQLNGRAVASKSIGRGFGSHQDHN